MPNVSFAAALASYLAALLAESSLAESPKPAITISKETTVITEPLTADGLPDYEAYLLREGKRGVTPENNAAVLLWEALWPGELEPADRQPMLDALGMKSEPDAAKALVPVLGDATLARVAKWLGDPDDLEAAKALIKQAMRTPWTAGQIPPLAAWVEENNAALDLIVEAVKRPKYWSPSPQFLNGKRDPLFTAVLPLTRCSRDGIGGLSVRCMLKLGKGQLASAWRETRASYRIANCTSLGFCVPELLYCIEKEIEANHQAMAILQHTLLPNSIPRDVLTHLKSLPKLPRMKDFINSGERMIYVDAGIALAMGNHPEIDVETDTFNVDWDMVIKDGNELVDRLVESGKSSDRQRRAEQLQAIYSEVDRRADMAGSIIVNIAVRFSRNAWSKHMANVLSAFMTPMIDKAYEAEDRSTTHRKLTLTAAALAVYRAEHRAYPEKLADLVPDILSEMPIDLYSGEPFLYEWKDDGGYLLYSVYENGKDDGGTAALQPIVAGEWSDDPTVKNDYEASDLVIRVPLPPIKLPQPQDGASPREEK